MKSKIFYLSAVTLLFFMYSCGPSLKVTSDYDHNATFTNYKTFHVYDIKAKEGQVSQLNADRIVNAIKAEMTAKGLTESENPDIWVNAVTIVKDKQTVTANTDYYGYGGVYRPYGYWGGAGMASGTTTYNTYDYKDGSLIIDVVDSKTTKMVWRGVGNAEIDKMPKNPDEFMNNVVKKILAEFPPVTGK